MKEFKTREEAIEHVERENYYYRNQGLKSYEVLEKNACDFFKEITIELEDEQEYYESFGLDVGECHQRLVKTECFYIEEEYSVIEVKYYECYIDSGSSDYFHAYYIKEK